MENVGGRIRAARENAGLRRETLACRIGWSASTLSQWETGQRIPGLDAVEAIAAACGASPSELCGWDAPKPKPEPKPSYVALHEQLSKLAYKANAEQLGLTVRFLRAMIGPPR